MKKTIIFGMAGTALIIGAVAYILRKVEESQNRNDVNLSDLDDFEIAEDEDEDEESEEDDDDDKLEADSGECIKMCTLKEFPLPNGIDAITLYNAVKVIISENRASILNLYGKHHFSYGTAESIIEYLIETGCVGKFQKGHTRKLNRDRLMELSNQLKEMKEVEA